MGQGLRRITYYIPEIPEPLELTWENVQSEQKSKIAYNQNLKIIYFRKKNYITSFLENMSKEDYTELKESNTFDKSLKILEGKERIKRKSILPKK